MANKFRSTSEHQKEFVKLFDRLCARHNRWTVWCDLMHMGAVSISNAVARNRCQERESSYKESIRKYTLEEAALFPEMFTVVVAALEQNQDQDFLGELYMQLNLSSAHKGQFFTPYNLCRCMAQMNMDGLTGELQKKSWVSVLDPCCGAGALFIAFANECRRNGINYQTDVLFVGQDIDPVVAKMCYIQLSLLGCPGYVVIGDSLSEPAVSMDSHVLLPNSQQNIWYTPMFFRDVWQGRAAFAAVETMMRKGVSNEDQRILEGIA